MISALTNSSEMKARRYVPADPPRAHRKLNRPWSMRIDLNPHVFGAVSVFKANELMWGSYFLRLQLVLKHQSFFLHTYVGRRFDFGHSCLTVDLGSTRLSCGGHNV